MNGDVLIQERTQTGVEAEAPPTPLPPPTRATYEERQAGRQAQAAAAYSFHLPPPRCTLTPPTGQLSRPPLYTARRCRQPACTWYTNTHRSKVRVAENGAMGGRLTHFVACTDNKTTFDHASTPFITDHTVPPLMYCSRVASQEPSLSHSVV